MNLRYKKMVREFWQGKRASFNRWRLHGDYKGVNIARLVQFLEADTRDRRFFPGVWDDRLEYWFDDRGASILAVCHVDTVDDGIGFMSRKYARKLPRAKIAFDKDYSPYVNTIALDDRLGVFVVSELLPRLYPWIEYDLLLTTGEESMMSTAQVAVDKLDRGRYNWVFEFDRRLDDVVCYQYGAVREWVTALQSCFTVGRGSYSDIADLDELEVCGVNVGVGYDFEHTNRCTASIDMMLSQVEKFSRFYRKYSGLKFEYDLDEHGFGGRRAFDWWAESDKIGRREYSQARLVDGTQDWYKCDFCKVKHAELIYLPEWYVYVCADCYESAVKQGYYTHQDFPGAGSSSTDDGLSPGLSLEDVEAGYRLDVCEYCGISDIPVRDVESWGASLCKDCEDRVLSGKW